jgi:hypothetical protein
VTPLSLKIAWSPRRTRSCYPASASVASSGARRRARRGRGSPRRPAPGARPPTCASLSHRSRVGAAARRRAPRSSLLHRRGPWRTTGRAEECHLENLGSGFHLEQCSRGVAELPAHYTTGGSRPPARLSIPSIVVKDKRGYNR